MIEGVVVKELTTSSDERGFFREIGRFDEIGFTPKQVSHACRVAGVANGWHIHRWHDELFYLTKGVIRLCLRDCREGREVRVSFPYEDVFDSWEFYHYSSTPECYEEYILSEFAPSMIIVPHGVAHAYRVLETCDLIYVTTEDYSKTRLDEGRIEWDRWPEHNWTRETEIR